ncbi:GAF domain-containing sensor histidine kinase [Oscillatoria acuminata]|uniref:histidine kinase n=1 Tax=Oscillatoria acuminata PCC 6304 TaxID=56110 RepID=K9TB99_9CYAN|nr:GAF domain-containing sensor histidine kinase [Oscillatoria acuminata]AFY79785.1 signal transduction histidine kinase [Oscillatoria acuminata PCC 6304]
MSEQQSKKSQQLLLEIAKSIHRTSNLERIWQQTARDLGSGLGASRCVIYSYQEENQPLKVVAEYQRQAMASMLGWEVRLEECPEIGRAIATLEPVLVDTTLPQENGERYSTLIVPTAYEDRPNGAIVLYHQVHKSKLHREHCPFLWSEAEIELVQEVAKQAGSAIASATLYHQLQEARQQAQEAARLKHDFLGKISHEFRTPLNHIIGFLQLILDDMVDDSEEQREFIHEAHHSALHFLQMINDVLDFNKPKTIPLIELEFSPVNLHKLLKNIERCTFNQIESKQLTFKIIQPSNSRNICLQGNEKQLLQVMLNIVGNAIKFTDKGGITIEVETITHKVLNEDVDPPNGIEIRISDTGIGVPLEYQSRLFEPFFRVHEAYTSPYPGTGLGLSLSKKIIEGMGGEIHFYSMGEGLGSTVTVNLPLAAPCLSSKSSPEISPSLNLQSTPIAEECG